MFEHSNGRAPTVERLAEIAHFLLHYMELADKMDDALAAMDDALAAKGRALDAKAKAMERALDAKAKRLEVDGCLTGTQELLLAALDDLTIQEGNGPFASHLIARQAGMRNPDQPRHREQLKILSRLGYCTPSSKGFARTPKPYRNLI
jgi:hypothetical protein